MFDTGKHLLMFINWIYHFHVMIFQCRWSHLYAGRVKQRQAIPTAGRMNRYTTEDNKRSTVWIANLRTDQTAGHTIFC